MKCFEMYIHINLSGDVAEEARASTKAFSLPASTSQRSLFDSYENKLLVRDRKLLPRDTNDHDLTFLCRYNFASRRVFPRGIQTRSSHGIFTLLFNLLITQRVLLPNNSRSGTVITSSLNNLLCFFPRSKMQSSHKELQLCY